MTKLLKYEITKAVLKQLPYEDQHLEKIIRIWWFTMTQDGLRLTDIGDKKFREAQIEYFDCPIKVTQQSWYSFINECSKKLKCPYFLGVNKKDNERPSPYVRLYDSKIAMVLTLYGDIQSYLGSIKVRK